MLGADGVLVGTIDMPGRTMNVFSADLMDALEALVDRVDRPDLLARDPDALAGIARRIAQAS